MPRKPGTGKTGPKRGRPPRTPEQRAAAKERRITQSVKGRLKFRPGDKHALDVQAREARNYSALIAAQLDQLQATQADLNELDDPGVMVSREEHALKAFLWEEYQEHKHRDHIAATFLAIRRQRLLARLQAANDALQIARDLLTPNDTLLQDLRAAVEEARQATEIRAQQPKTQQPRRADQEEQGTQIDSRHLYGDLVKARAQLARFDAQVQTMRAAISPAIGWFEEFYIKKTRYTSQAREHLKRNEPIPDDVQALEDIWYGPYLKYRWQEVTGGPAYAIQMSLIPDEEIQAAKTWAAILDDDEDSKAERGGDPWPNL